jgi:hypothetical protein
MYRNSALWISIVCAALAAAMPVTAAEEINVLRATGISIDGNPDEWDLLDFTSLSLAGQDGNGDIALIGYHNGSNHYGEYCTEATCDLPSSTQDFRARVWSRHDDTFLYFLIRFDDDNKQCPNGAGANWANDCAEIYLDPANDHGLTMSNTSDIQLVVDRCSQVNVYTTTADYRTQVLAGVTAAATDTVYEGYLGSWIEMSILKSVLDPDLASSTGDFGVNFNFRDNDGSLSSILDWSGDWIGSGGFPTKRPADWGDALAASTDIPNLTLYAKAAGAITIDGDAGDWDLGSFTIPVWGGGSGAGDVAFIGYGGDSVYRGGFCPGTVLPDNAGDHSVQVYSMHDASYQYFFVQFADDDLQSPNGVGMNWANDCIEFYVNPAHDAGASPLGGSETSNFQLVIDVANQQNVYHATPSYAAQVLGGVTSAVTTSGSGWMLEVRIDKTVADPDVPADGTFGVDFNVRDNDNGNDPNLTSIYSWRDPYHEGASFACPTKRPKNWGDVDNVECVSAGDCDNELHCDGAETCGTNGVCQAGTPPDCNDGVNCTVDLCDELNDQCVNIASNGLCDNGAWCDGAEICDAVLDCVAGTAPDCDDGVSCTIDSCDELNDMCVTAPSNGLCDNGAYCDGAEICDVLLDCLPGTAPDCNDSVNCTIDSCDELNDVCVNTPSNSLCDNAVYCDGAELCDELLDCQPGADPCLLTQWCYETSDQCIDYGDGDTEPDGDIDLFDFLVFQRCFGQLGLGDCQALNLTGEGTIGLADYEAFAPMLDAGGPE